MNPIKRSLALLWISHFFMDFFTGIWPIYKTLAGIDVALAGLIAGISGFIGEILQLGFGYLSDLGHRKRVMLLGLILSSSIIWITFTTHIFSAFFLLLLVMIGSGSFHPAAMGLTSNLAGEKKGSAILFFSSGGALGLGISQLTFTKLQEVFDGHAFVIFAPLILLVFVLFSHEFPRQTYAKPAPLKNFFQPIMHQKKPLLLLYFSQVAIQGLMLSFTFLLPDILKMRTCHSWLCLGGGHLFFILGAAFMMVPVGWMCDRFGQKKILLCAVCLASFFLFLFLTQPPATLAGTACLLATLGAFLGIINPIIVSWGHRLVPESPSTISALLMGFAWCFSSLCPACAGLLSKFYSEEPYLNALATIGGLLFLIFFFILLMPRPQLQKATE